jgi:predicted  nucleic acid-binding Zn-ribbon protein
MDNRINKIRKKISVLRAEMLEAERTMHRQVAHDQDCSDAATRLMAMRAELVRMIGERRTLGDLMPIGQPDPRKSRIARLKRDLSAT